MAATLVPNNTVTIIEPGAPTDAVFSTPPPDGQEYIDSNTIIKYVRVKGVWYPMSQTPSFAALTAPTLGAVAQSFDRAAATIADLTIATTGQLYYMQLPLPVGALVSALTFRSGETAASTPTHQWACLMDSTRAIQAISADKTTTAWAADTDVTFTMGTAFRIPSGGPWYAGLMVAASTVPTIDGVVDYDAENATDPPILCGVGTPTSATVPPALLVVQGAITASANKAWVGVS